jgi:hypothetical protein
MYPDRDWLPWKFDDRPLNFWDDVKKQRKFMDWAAVQLNIKEMSDWYKVTQKVTLPLNGILRLFSNWLPLELMVSSVNTLAHIHVYSPMCTQNMTGYHGDLKNVLVTIGMT